ncbi:MAG TPA: recombinase family protein, partial [Acidimicrobiales bacterium]|nr:recombinase family protein [Acidimicrobiales bacterium]
MHPSQTSRKSKAAQKPGGPKQAVLYLRVSTTEQARRGGEAEGFSIPVQRDTARTRAEMLGAMVVDEFIDAGKSDTTNRDGLKALLDYVEAERPTYVIVYKLDRLSRNLANGIAIRRAISTAGSQLISCSEPVDDSSPMGVMVLNMMDNWNEYYSNNLGEEMKGKLIAKIRSGGTIGKAPIGYLNRVQRISGVEVHDVVVDEVRGPLMAWVFEAFSTGDWSFNTITEEAQAKGLTTVPTRQMAEKPIPRSTLARLLRNPYYAGVLRWKGAVYPGAQQALVTNEVFDRVQSILDSHDLGGQKQRVHNHYLKGSVFCDQCGSSMCITKTVNRHGTEYLYYFCLGRYRRRTDCTQRAIPVELVEAHIEKKWQSVQFDADYAHQFRDLMVDDLVGYRETQEKDKARAARRRTQLNEQRLKLMNAHYMDAIPLELLRDEQERITRELEDTAEKLRAANVTIEKIDKIMRQSLEFLANCYTTYVAATPQLRRQLNQAVFEAFMVTS